nr:unnamed protein product [Callosobruchus analis]
MYISVHAKLISPAVLHNVIRHLCSQVVSYYLNSMIDAERVITTVILDSTSHIVLPRLVINKKLYIVRRLSLLNNVRIIQYSFLKNFPSNDSLAGYRINKEIHLDADDDTEIPELIMNVEQTGVELVKDALFKDSKDHIIQKLKSCASIEEALTVFHLQSIPHNIDHIAQTILVMVDIQTMFFHYSSTNQQSRENFINSLLANIDFEKFLKTVEANVHNFPTHTLSYVLFYLSKLGLKADSMLIQLLSVELSHHLEQNFNISYCSKLFRVIFSEYSIRPYYISLPLIPTVISLIGKCQTVSQLEDLTTCLNKLNNIVTKETLCRYKEEVRLFLKEQKLHASNSALLKIIMFLNYPQWRHDNIALIVECILVLREDINSLRVNELLMIYEVFFKNQEPGEVLNDLQRGVGKHLKQIDEGESIDLDKHLLLFSALIYFSSPINKMQYRKDIEHIFNDCTNNNVNCHTLVTLRKIFSFVKISDQKICEKFWDLTLDVIKRENSANNIWKLCNNYLKFNTDLTSFRHYEFEKWMNSYIQKKMLSYEFITPSEVASFLAFMLVYGKNDNLISAVVDRFEANITQFKASDCLKVSYSLVALNTNQDKFLLQKYEKKTKKMLNDITENLLQYNESNYEQNIFLLKSAILRNDLDHYTVENMLVKYKEMEYMSSKIMESICFIYLSAGSLIPEVVNKCTEYVINNRQNIIGFNAEKILYLCYFLAYYPINAEKFFQILRIDSGDNKLKSHFEKCRRNAIYTSPRIQNELINLCGEVIQENVISEVRKTMAYSILADETADVSGKEQLSIGVRFYDESKSKIREEFVGFVELKAQNASAIAEAIDNFLISSNLSKEDCVGFGFDGCSTMAGKEGGVQAILRKKYPRALYFHCSSHKLNLVVNDANAVPEIRNTVATVKDVITFFRESTTRRNYAPNLSRLCETRWSEKYKSIRKFSQHFSELVKSLETLSVEGNYATRKSAYQLHSAVTKPVFIVSLQTIAKYSAVIEPVVNALQAKSIDMISVGKHIKNIKDILRNDREFPDRISNEILQKARAVAMDLNIEISVPRLAHKQTHRSNPPSDNDNEYWRRSLIIPYIDSLISSLNIRFSQENTPAFALSRLHPLYMTKTSIADLHKNAESFQEFYNLDITGELNLWHNLWVTKALSDDQLKDIEVVDLFKEANIFYPAVRKALIILSTIPCTTATVERSFSTLRRVKTWLRSTMGEERLTAFLQSALALCFFNKLPSSFIKQIFTVEFMDKLDAELAGCYSRETYPQRVRNCLMQLNRAVCLEYPEYNVPWFHKKYVDEIKIKYMRRESELLFPLRIKDYLTEVAGNAGGVAENVITPYGYHIDFVISLNKTDEVVHCEVAILLFRPYCYTRFYTHPKGKYQHKKRHLEMFGYEVSVAKFSEWVNLLYAEERLEFISNLIWPKKIENSTDNCNVKNR